MPARAGLWTQDQARDMLALLAATYDRGRPGLASWRTVQDTTNDPIIAQRAPLPYRNYQASEDYYSAGLLIWLDVDAKLRELSHGTRSIDDFAKAFFGGHDGVWAASTYTFEDVVKALNGLEPFGWTAFLRDRLDGHGPWIDGFEAHGWKLVYTAEPSAEAKAMEAARHGVDLTYSLGLSVGKTGALEDVLWDGPAFKAGLAPGMSLVAVDGHAYSAAALKAAVTDAARDPHAVIELLVRNFDEFRTLRIEYHGGLRYPHLVRDASRPDTLTELLKAR
jgi:predicted metalloprotease with PDZ domain